MEQLSTFVFSMLLIVGITFAICYGVWCWTMKANPEPSEDSQWKKFDEENKKFEREHSNHMVRVEDEGVYPCD